MAKFKTRARAVDLLGRQQIAGIPNAISELFKNAHDAYADRVEVDFFPRDQLFVLRDDGLGMTQQDFEERWLTIGTESKVQSPKGISSPPSDRTKALRPIMGEKGIGRLAIAVVGPQVLVLTRAKRENKLENLVAAFLNWGLFEAPGVNLEQIDIPLRTFTGGILPNDTDIQEMVDAVRQNVLNLQNGGFLEHEHCKNMIEQLNEFKFSLQDIAHFLDYPSILGRGHGTQFYIQPVKEELIEDLDQINTKKGESRIRKLLLGFTNTTNLEIKPAISTSFRYWENDEVATDLLSDSEFFTPDEFTSADHHFKGDFDEFGQFKGTVTIYGKAPQPHVISWRIGKRKAACGPFRINIAYLQGLASESRLPPEDHARLSRKLDMLGGLYIYKDSIRILPYGDSDVDFLNIERRRTQSFRRYFFSYRRIFGAVDLTQDENRALNEKAGREGFQDNKAFRDFKNILENFLIQIAADFFQPKSPNNIYDTTRSEYQAIDKAVRQQEEINKEKRLYLQNNLENFFQKLDQNTPSEELNVIINALEQDIRTAAQKMDEKLLLAAEKSANQKLKELRNTYKIQRLQVGLSTRLQQYWDAYEIELQHLENGLFRQSQIQIQEVVTQANDELRFMLDKRKRIELLLNEIVAEVMNNTLNEIQETRKSLDKLRGDFNNLARKANEAVAKATATIEKQIQETDLINKSSEEIDVYRKMWEDLIYKDSQQKIDILKQVQMQIQTIKWESDNDGNFIGAADVAARSESKKLALQDYADESMELIQLGMAIEIINHEFDNTIRVIRQGLRRLQNWSKANPALVPVYEEIYNSFTHLDGYLNLFTPLHRRLYRTAVEIKGTSIVTYLKDLFRERFDVYEINLKATSSFNKTTVIGYPSTFYPVFVNLVDNAIYWLQNTESPREIKLDARAGAFIISDNGPGISATDHKAIFEERFTKKPGGRGMGLYISREVLKREGLQLELDTQNTSKGATFIIKPIRA